MVKHSNPNPNGKALIDCPGCKQRKELHAKGYCYACYKKLIWKPKTIICKSCGRKRPHKAFGLCSGCHTRLHHYDKTLSFNAKKYHDLDYDVLKKITKSCASCGFDKIVQLHHLDGNNKNRDSRNLVGLCPNCHKMIHMYEFCDEIKQNLKNKGFDVSKVHPTSYANKR